MRWFAFVIVLMLALTTTWAAPDTPLIITMNGDIFTVSPSDPNTLNQLTTWGYNEAAILSPDGSRVAYNSWAQVTVEAIQNQGEEVLFNGQPPSNIWVMDIPSGDAVRIATQPENAQAVEYGFENALMRSTPTWSPDGTQLAWTELSSVFPSEDGLKLMVYDFANNTTTTLTQNMPMGFQDVGIYLPRVLWTKLGFVMNLATILPPGLPGGLGEEILIFDTNGKLTRTIEIGSIGYSGSLVVTDNEILKENDHDVWDVISNNFEAIAEPPFILSAEAEKSFALQPFDSETIYGAFNWKLDDVTVISDAQIDQIALSPNGSWVAYVSEAGVSLVSLNDQITTLIPGTTGSKIDGVAWGKAQWAYGETFPQAAAQPETCTGVDNPLSTAAQVQINPSLDQPVNVYAMRMPLRYVIGRLQPEATVSVSGSECADGNIYLQISFDSGTGWIQTGISENSEAWVLQR